MTAPLCFILTASDEAFEKLIAPAVRDAGLEPWRPAPETPPISFFEQLVLCRFAVVDPAGADPDIDYWYREAFWPGSTVTLSATDRSREAIAQALKQRRAAAPHPSILYLLNEATDHTKTDVFREEVQRAGGEVSEAVALVDRLLSLRGASAWSGMIEFVSKMPLPLARTVMVREQTAWALNRLGKREEAESILQELLAERGPSSETCAILGRVYKDRWDETHDPSWLDKAIHAYLAGFEADWRDAYPGINAVTLMELADPPDERRKQIVPVVRYAVERRIANGNPDYWDYATLVELAVLAEDRPEAEKMLARALASVREKWEPETTARNLRLIRESRERRGRAVAWAEGIERALERDNFPQRREARKEP